jgi:transposase
MARPRIHPNPENGRIDELKETSRVGSIETAQRCTAIQFLLTGTPRENVCQALMVSNRALRNWINAFNDKGVDGLIVKKRPGRTAVFKGTDADKYGTLIAQPEKANREFWTAKAFHGYIGETYGLECSYQTVVRFFHKQGYALKVPQPCPDRQDEEKRQKFLKELELRYKDKNTDIWFQDESGFEGDPRPRRRWDKKGTKSKVVKNGDHLRMNVMGMVCPRTGEFFALETSHSDTETFQAFLDEASDNISFTRKQNILIMDNASWHKKKTLNFHGFEPKFLPPYSPDLNPIERIWNTMKARWFNNHVCRNPQQLIERLDVAILDVIDNPKRTQKTTAIGKLF